MYFLIDYENVRNLGMRGSEYLLPSDHVIIFYSVGVPSMELRHLNNIRSSGCEFEVCELFMKRKNGLDFYIATKVGEIFGAERCKHAVIVSNDSGFQALRDFWQERSKTAHRVVISESIEHGIVSVNEVSERADLIRTNRKPENIGHFYAFLQEEIRRQNALRDAFEGSEYEARLQEIGDVLKTQTSLKLMYLESLRRFGRKGGQEVYQRLKSIAGL